MRKKMKGRQIVVKSMRTIATRKRLVQNTGKGKILHASSLAWGKIHYLSFSPSAFGTHVAQGPKKRKQRFSRQKRKRCGVQQYVEARYGSDQVVWPSSSSFLIRVTWSSLAANLVRGTLSRFRSPKIILSEEGVFGRRRLFQRAWFWKTSDFVVHALRTN